jgi:hypothetical protein
MPRNCGCAGSTCGCLVQGGAGVTVTGLGSATEPYVIGWDGATAGYVDVIPEFTTPGSSWAFGTAPSVDTVVRLRTDVALTIALPDTAPLGLRVDFIVSHYVTSTALTFTSTDLLLWLNGASAPTLNTGITWISFMHILESGTQNAWVGAVYRSAT